MSTTQCHMLIRAKLGLTLTICVVVTVGFLYYVVVVSDIHGTRGHPGGLHQWMRTRGDRVGGTPKFKNSGNSKLRKGVPSHQQGVDYVGQHPICTSLQIKGQMLPPCYTVRRSPATGEIKVNLTTLSDEKLEVQHGADLESGGLYRPRDCSPNQRVAIVVPYRDRSVHLKVFLNNIIPFMKKQKIEYMIIVVEQAPGSQVNRGMLRNIGFVEGEKICNFDCYIFHDVDMIPLKEGNFYTCGDSPRHHAASLARWNNRLPYQNIFGGVVSFKKGLFKKTNGYSNMYFGWGGEDDDLYKRVRYHKMKVDRYPMAVSKYGDLKHRKSEIRNVRYTYLKRWKKRIKIDGLNSLKYQKYLVEFRKLYTWIYVGICEKEILKQYPYSCSTA